MPLISQREEYTKMTGINVKQVTMDLAIPCLVKINYHQMHQEQEEQLTQRQLWNFIKRILLWEEALYGQLLL